MPGVLGGVSQVRMLQLLHRCRFDLEDLLQTLALGAELLRARGHYLQSPWALGRDPRTCEAVRAAGASDCGVAATMACFLAHAALTDDPCVLRTWQQHLRNLSVAEGLYTDCARALKEMRQMSALYATRIPLPSPRLLLAHQR